jgi:hypothetical protein
MLNNKDIITIEEVHEVWYLVETMDADDWLKSVEKKLQVVQYRSCKWCNATTVRRCR